MSGSRAGLNSIVIVSHGAIWRCRLRCLLTHFVYAARRVPAFYNAGLRLKGDGQGRAVLIDSTLTGLPGAEEVAAIETLGNMYACNVATPGYGVGLINQNQASFRGFRGQDGIDGAHIDEWWSSGARDRGAGGFASLMAK